MNTNTRTHTSQLVLIGLIAAILLLMAYTPLGYLNIGPLAITFNVIPVAIAAITLGPSGGAAAGAIFGMTSFLQCIGIGGTSAMGAILFDINLFLPLSSVSFRVYSMVSYSAIFSVLQEN